MAKRVLHRQDYKVGWICALPIELAAAQEILDEEHDYFDNEQSKTDRTASIYTLGRVGDHNVVLAGLPAGQLGTNSAAATAIQIQRDFPSIQFGLMVGIGGGVPSDANDIRLGDVVVSQPQMMHGGVIQYDLGKTRPNTFERTGFLNSPPTVLLEAVAQLQARQFRSHEIFSKHISGFKHLPDFSRDYAGPDRLYQSNYSHVGGPDCDNCSEEYLIKRPVRKGLGIKVHRGTIASGNQVMRDGVERDRLSSDLGGVLCFEMEAAGLMNRFPCLAIRGICDYADSHKNKRWQPYAAMTAAVYAKALLSVVPSLEPTPTLNEFIARRGNNEAAKILKLNCQKLLESLEFPEMYRRHIVIKRPCQGTGNWLFQTKEYQEWLKGTHRFLWIKGKAGAGKSVLMKRTLQELQIRSDDEPPTVASFFYDGSGTALEKSGTGLLRAILYQIFKQNRNLVEEFMTASDSQFVKGRGLGWELRELMEAFEISSKLQSWRPTILLLDGLDEGSAEEVRALVFFSSSRSFPSTPKIQTS
ncbi:Vegetative incompatibility protein HET-E-1 [Fusarium oxysporum f. sp. raphani]|uniref:Vegetative incompatibility protein HET-E-1 n=1 Tax=Fusarium oxysporum f. sp. raphani TaxID=96318 RepID=A0A8J5U3H1_FUSOX|nr:Vegetative incompatibility protein HET-E-1 [Fusarium oxysporum f. sp. raphani]